MYTLVSIPSIVLLLYPRKLSLWCYIGITLSVPPSIRPSGSISCPFINFSAQTSHNLSHSSFRREGQRSSPLINMSVSKETDLVRFNFVHVECFIFLLSFYDHIYIYIQLCNYYSCLVICIKFHLFRWFLSFVQVFAFAII